MIAYDLIILFLPPPTLLISINLQYGLLALTVLSPALTSLSATLSSSHDFGDFEKIDKCFGDKHYGEKIRDGIIRESEGSRRIDTWAKPGGIVIATVAILLSLYRLILLNKQRNNISSKIQTKSLKKPQAKLKERAAKYIEHGKELEETGKFEKDQMEDSILEELKKAN